MSHFMTALAMRQTGLKPAAKIVLYWLADHHNETTGDCFPSINRLAELCEMSRRSVETQIASLEADGLVERVNRMRVGGGKTSNGYILRLVESDAQNLRIGYAKSAHGDAQNMRMNNLGRNNLGKEHTPKPPEGADDDFEKFWDVVPRKVGRGQAEKAWRAALKGADAATIIAAMKRYAEQRKGQEQQYTAHPSTWLNGKRWLDETNKPAAPATVELTSEHPTIAAIKAGKRHLLQQTSASFARQAIERGLVTQAECTSVGLL